MDETSQSPAEPADGASTPGEPDGGRHGGARRRKSRNRLGKLKTAQRDKHRKSARAVLVVVAVVFLCSGFVTWFGVKSDYDQYRADPRLTADEEAMTRANVLLVTSTVISAVYVGLFFWSNRSLLGATAAGLVLFLADQVAGLVLDPGSLTRGLILKVFVLLALVKGVQSAVAYRKMEESASRTS